MQVAFYTECYRPIVNGVTASIESLRDGLERAGARVTTIAPFFPRCKDDDADAVVRLPSLPLPTQTGYRLCVPLLPRGARERLHALDVVHAHSPFVTGWMARAYAREHGLPLVFTYHTRLDAYAHYAPFGREATRRAMLRLTRAFADRCDAVVVPTRAIETRLRELGVGARIAVVPSAIDVTRFSTGRRSLAVRALLGAHDDTPLVLTVSRLGQEKNVELALDALARLSGAVLAVVGDGPQRRALEARAVGLGIAERVRFCGALQSQALPDVYASADAFVFASPSETQGLVLAEALAAGLSIAAVDVPVTREILGGRGFLSLPDPAALAAAVAAALRAGRDPGGPRFAEARFGRELQARRILDLYAGLGAAFRSAVHLAQ